MNTNTEKSHKIEKLLDSLSSAEADLDAFMELTVNEIVSLTPGTGAVVEIVEGDEMVYRAAKGVMEIYIGLRLPKASSISGLCVESRDILYSEDTELDSRVNLEACRKVKARSLIVAPLFHLGNAIGVLKIISDKPKAFTDEDIAVLKQVSNCLGNALSRQIIEEIKKFY